MKPILILSLSLLTACGDHYHEPNKTDVKVIVVIDGCEVFEVKDKTGKVSHEVVCPKQAEE